MKKGHRFKRHLLEKSYFEKYMKIKLSINNIKGFKLSLYKGVSFYIEDDNTKIFMDCRFEWSQNLTLDKIKLFSFITWSL